MTAHIHPNPPRPPFGPRNVPTDSCDVCGIEVELDEPGEPTTCPLCRALDEIDRLRAWQAEATQVMRGWEFCYDALPEPDRRPLGGLKSVAVLHFIWRQTATSTAPPTPTPEDS